MNPARAHRIFILVAGEASGDQLGADLIRSLRQIYPDAQFKGIGGTQMIKSGLQSWWPMEMLSVMGLFEVLKHLPSLLLLRKKLRNRIMQSSPDCFIGIDAPDFNLGLEKSLKAAGIRTVHYVSPSIWAWRENRAAKIAQSADRVLCLFPIEPPIYEQYGVKATFVGHPVADQMPLEPDTAHARAELNIDANAAVLCLMPGSRGAEIERLGALFLDSASLLLKTIPTLKIILPAANARCFAQMQAMLDSHPIRNLVTLINGQSHLCMQAADVVLLASGTATLEVMLAKKPMVVAYKISPLTYFIVKTFGMLKTTRYALPNILANADIVPEFMQDQATAKNLASALQNYFFDSKLSKTSISKFIEIHHALKQNASYSAALAIQQLFESDPNKFSDRETNELNKRNNEFP